MMRESSYGNIPRLFKIFHGEVANLMTYGAFIKIPGCRKQGLVHISQMSNTRVDDPSEMLARGERVYCKVIAVEGDGDKIALSMKVVNQRTGQDLDPSNVQSSQDEKKRRQFNFRGSRRIELGAELNTTCRRCGGHGHLAMDCYSAKGDNHYGLIPDMDRMGDSDDDRSGRRHRKKDKKKEKKQKSRKRESSSGSDGSEDSGPEEDQKRASARAFSGGYGDRKDRGRRPSDSDSSSDRNKAGKRDRFDKQNSRDRFKEKGRREKSDGRRKIDHSDSDSDSKGHGHRQMAGRSQDFQHPTSRAWQAGGSRERTHGRKDEERVRTASNERPAPRRSLDMMGGRLVDRTSEHRDGDVPRKRFKSESDSEEERVREKRGRVNREQSDSGRYMEDSRKRDTSETKDRRWATSGGAREAGRFRREKS